MSKDDKPTQQNVDAVPLANGLPIAAYNVVFVVLLIAAAYTWFSAFALEYETFKKDNAYGATANAAERLPCFIAGGSLLICAFLCRVVIAIKRLAAKIPARGLG